MPDGILAALDRAPSGQVNPIVASKRIPTLDGLRAISITLVLLNHLVGTQYYPARLSPLGQFGNFGVRVFFVISGYLITSLLIKEQGRSGSISLKNFYLRRVFRIFPAAYTYILVLGLLNARFGILRQHDLFFAATYLTNFHLNRAWYVGHLWSLAVEEQFYMLWPVVLAFWGIKRGSRVALATILLSPAARVVSWYALPAMRERIGEMFFTVADPIAFGCLLALQRRWLWEQRWYLAIMKSRWFFLVPVAALALRFTGQHPMINFVIAQPLMNIGIVLTLDWCMSHANSPVGRFLDWKPIAFLGTLSYSLYLWQTLFLNHFSQTPWTAFPINIIFALVVALASYKLVEQPFLKLKEMLQAKPVSAPSRDPRTPLSLPASKTPGV